MKNTVVLILLSTLALLLSHCSTQKGMINSSHLDQTISLQDRNVQLKFYHQSDDSSSLLLKIKNTELLENRSIGSDILKAKVNSTLTLFDPKTNEPLDTITYDIAGQTKQSGTFFYFNKHSFLLNSGKSYHYSLSLNDKNRGTYFRMVGSINKSQEICKENLLLFELGSKIPELTFTMNSDKMYSLTSERIDLSSTELWFNSSENSLPPPPYSTSHTDLPEITSFQKLDINELDGTIVFQDLNIGSFLIRKKTSGVTIISKPSHFPEVGSVADMVLPLRYISARKEFERLNSNSNLKNGLEKFWLDCGDNKDRSQELMATFYSRIEKANLNFSSYKSGWKTDKGLIFIVFGEPTDLQFTENTETWSYGDKSDIGTIEFVFDKAENKLSSNHYELRRNTIYKSEWAKRVSAWRNGRIYN